MILLRLSVKVPLATLRYPFVMQTGRSAIDLPEAGDSSYVHVLDVPIRLLIVDDDPIQREFATVYLATPAAEIITASHGEHALIRLRNEKFDIVLLDYEMPGMNGIDVIKAIRKDKDLQHLPVIMVTSHEDISTIDAAYRAGATSFATKPVNWRLLSYQIRYVLRAHSAMTEAGRDE